MIYLDCKQTQVLIQSGKNANELLAKGHNIVKVIPDRKNRIKTNFVFYKDSALIGDIMKLVVPPAEDEAPF